MALHTPSIGHRTAPHVSTGALAVGLITAATIGVVIVAAALRPVALPAPEVTGDGGGRTLPTTNWAEYNPTYGSFERLFVFQRQLAPDAEGRTTLDTNWATYDPVYGSYGVLAVDANGRTTPATDWSHYDPTYGSFVTRAVDAQGRSLPQTDWSHYDPTYGSWR